MNSQEKKASKRTPSIIFVIQEMLVFQKVIIMFMFYGLNKMEIR